MTRREVEQMEKKTISVFALDDNHADLELISRHLEEIPGWEVELITATDWAGGRVEWERRAPEVMLLDYRLGAETGLDVVNDVRQAGDDRPIIVLTGESSPRIAAEITRAGADDYLVKQNLDADMLRRTIVSVIEQCRLRREKKLLAQELQQAQKLETIGTLAGGIAHDFNNMLTVIMGYVELAILKSRGREVCGDLDHVRRVCKQMAELVQCLLSFSRREGSAKTTVNLRHVIKETEVVLRHTLPKNVELRVDRSQDPLVLNGNVSMLHQVLLNLCVNAAEAMPEGGALTIRAERFTVDANFALGHPALSEGEHILLEVQDTGIGMSAEVRERIFEPFFTTKGLGSTRGTGLGLAVIWGNVQEHGGAINVYSEPQRGTTVRVYLPLAVGAREVKRRAGTDISTGFPRGSETVLVVDDEPLIRNLACEMLQRQGYHIALASDGLMALETYAELQDEIGVVLLDISMPKMDGRQCLKRLREIDPDVRVLLSSGHDMTYNAEELMNLGATGTIQKPYTISDLARRIRGVLDN